MICQPASRHYDGNQMFACWQPIMRKVTNMRTLGSRNQPRSYHKKEQKTIKISLDELPKHEKFEIPKSCAACRNRGTQTNFSISRFRLI